MKIKRAIKLSILYSLPLTIWPILTATLFTYFVNSRIPEQTEALQREAARWDQMEYFSVPGAPGIHDTALPPFHLVKLYSNDWWRKLNLIKPDEDQADTAGIDRIGMLDNLMYDSELGSTTHQWIYVTWLASPDYNAWDGAFDRLLRYHHRYPAAHGAPFHYVDCLDSPFLCGIWAVKQPSLVHFAIEEKEKGNGTEKDAADAEEAEGNGFHYSGIRGGKDSLRKVTVRVIDLPLETPRYGDANVFPSEFEQLRSLTAQEDAYEQFEEYSHFHQIWDRFSEWRDERWPLLKHLDAIEDWIEDHSGPLTSPMRYLKAAVFEVVSITLSVGFLLWRLLFGVYHWFVGFPGAPGTPVPDSPLAFSTGGDNFMSDLFSGFVEQLPPEAKQAIDDNRDVFDRILRGEQVDANAVEFNV